METEMPLSASTIGSFSAVTRSLRHRSGVVDDHSGVMKQALYDIHGVLRAVEVLGKLQHIAGIIGDTDIVPAVDIDLLDTVFPEIRRENRILRHLGIELF